jgi:hypothetical protein
MGAIHVEARFRRWNMVMIVILAFVVVGLLVVASVPHPVNTTTTISSAPLKNHTHTP